MKALVKTLIIYNLPFIICWLSGVEAISQNLGVNSTGATPHASAILDVDASPANNKGFLMPRLTTAQRIAIVAPANGLQVFDTNLGGYYYFSTITNKWDCANNPAGTVNYFANVNAPLGYLLCDGSAHSTTQYPELFNAIGYLYGGAGANFNVPDLRGEFVRGLDAGRGVDDDIIRNIGSNQKGTLMWYDSSPTLTVGSIIMDAATDPLARNFVGFDKSSDALWPNVRLTFLTNPSSNILNTNGPESIGGANADYGVIGTSRPRNIALLPCIKY